MAGPIQTAIGQTLAALAGAASLSKKFINANDRQAGEKENFEAKAETAKASAAPEAKEEINAGDAAKAYRIAQERGTASPEKIIFDEKGKPLATYNELATLISRQSMGNSESAKMRSRAAIKSRKEFLENKASSRIKGGK